MNVSSGNKAMAIRYTPRVRKIFGLAVLALVVIVASCGSSGLDKFEVGECYSGVVSFENLSSEVSCSDASPMDQRVVAVGTLDQVESNPACGNSMQYEIVYEAQDNAVCFQLILGVPGS